MVTHVKSGVFTPVDELGIAGTFLYLMASFLMDYHIAGLIAGATKG